MSQILFEDTIGIKSLNDAGKKFERGNIKNNFCSSFLVEIHVTGVSIFPLSVDRLHGRSRNYDIDFVLGMFFTFLV